MNTPINTAMRWGARAYKQGKGINENPFSWTSEHAEDWDAGWIAEQLMTKAYVADSQQQRVNKISNNQHRR